MVNRLLNVCVIDLPGIAVLQSQLAAGYFERPGAYERLLYLDLPRAERLGRFLPFNVLAQPLPPHNSWTRRIALARAMPIYPS